MRANLLTTITLGGIALAAAVALSCGNEDSGQSFIKAMQSVRPFPTGPADPTREALVQATTDALLETVVAVPTNVSIELTCEATAGHSVTPLPSADTSLVASCTPTPTATP